MSQTTINHDPFDRRTSVDGPWIKLKIEAENYEATFTAEISLSLRTVTTPVSKVHQLYVSSLSPAPLSYRRARAPGGKVVNFSQIDWRIIYGNYYKEDFALSLSETDLIRASKVPFAFKVYGKDDDFILGLPPSYYLGHIEKLAELELVDWRPPRTEKRKAKFIEEEYIPYGGSGTGTITGKLKHPGILFLNPATSYSKEWFQKQCIEHRRLEPADARVWKYHRRGFTTEGGFFTFGTLPIGDYYLFAKDAISGWSHAKVNVKAGEKTAAELTVSGWEGKK